MELRRNRVSITFTKDYAESKKGDILIVSRSIAHKLTKVEEVAELTKVEEVGLKTKKAK